MASRQRGRGTARPFGRMFLIFPNGRWPLLGVPVFSTVGAAGGAGL